MIVAVTGIRDLAVESHIVVGEAVAELVTMGATEWRFGGAIGADTTALLVALDHEGLNTRVFVPGLLVEQPAEAQRAARRASEVIELGMRLGTPAYMRRNRLLVDGEAYGPRADRVLGLTDGRRTGGTAYTMGYARKLGVPVHEVRVSGGTRR